MSRAGLGEPFKRGGNKSFVTEEQLKFLDNLDLWLKNNNGDVEQFLEQRYGIEQESTAITHTNGVGDPDLERFIKFASML
jgi:hypothetical protein